MNASTAETAQAIALAQTGMKTPFTMTSHPKTARSKCSNATIAKMRTARLANGFIYLASIGTEYARIRPQDVRKRTLVRPFWTPGGKINPTTL